MRIKYYLETKVPNKVYLEGAKCILPKFKPLYHLVSRRYKKIEASCYNSWGMKSNSPLGMSLQSQKEDINLTFKITIDPLKLITSYKLKDIHKSLPLFWL